ncbi:MAG: lysylphosphatidylglycerol synthase transmembrane domain-containing protein [Thermodesulfobacteriota bacterium]|nr:lysylphosphatidylglycerol synthase transmembrane domain-containing protein [Thermodesulfobacteriota bacterium]
MRIKTLIGILVSLIFLFLAFRNVSFKELFDSLQKANYIYLIPAIALVYLSMWLRAIRWKYLFEPIKEVRMSSLFSSLMIGFMANNILPARIGEFVRAYSIGKKENLSKSLSLATIVVERILDGFVLLVFLFISLIFFHFPNWVKKTGISLLIFQILILLLFFFLKRYKENVSHLFNLLFSPISIHLPQKANEILFSFIVGFDVLKGKKQIKFVFLFSFLMWIVIAVLTSLVFLSFRFELPLYGSFLFIVIVNFGIIMIPLSPGFIGTYQFFCITALAFWGINESEALGFSIVYHATQYFPVTLLGLFYLWKESISFKEIKRQ